MTLHDWDKTCHAQQHQRNRQHHSQQHQCIQHHRRIYYVVAAATASYVDCTLVFAEPSSENAETCPDYQ